MKCEICKLEINPSDKQCGYYTENKKIYCEKCYANKRFKEIEDKTLWLNNIQTIISSKQIKTNTLMRKIPTQWESLLNKEEVKKIRETWDRLNLTTYG